MVKKQKDIIWILLDALRVDYLNLEHPQESKKHNIEKILRQGMLYTNVIAAVKLSLGAGYSLGTGLFGAVTGMIGHDYDHSKEKPDVLFVGDYLKKLGYHTFHYTDYRLRHFPSSGFDIYEFCDYGGDYNLPGLSYDIPIRRQVLKSFRNTESPKFLFLHLETLHSMPNPLAKGKFVWASEIYEKAIPYLAKDLRIVLKQLRLTGEELLVLCSDHGMILDEPIAAKERREGTSMGPESIRTFCSFISSDVTPCVIDEQCSSIDIVPTIFELAGLPKIPVQGKSLVSTRGTATPICEGVARFDFPFDRGHSKAYSIYNGEWKLVVKNGRGKKLYRLKEGIEKEETISKHLDIVERLTSKLYRQLSTSANEVRNKQMIELKSRGEKVLSLTREDLPTRIVLLALDSDVDSLVYNLKGQIEHYFDLYVFGRGRQLSKKLKDIDTRIKVYDGELQSETIDKILGTYIKQPEFVGFVKSSIEYYDDYLYRLRRLLEINPQAQVAFSKFENGSESICLARSQLIKQLIEQGMKIKDLLLLPECDGNYLKVEYKYPLGTHQKRRLKICPLDNVTIELLEAEGIEYIGLGSLEENRVDIIACSGIKNVPTAQELADKFQAIAVYIDYDISAPNPEILSSDRLKVLKRKDTWLVLGGKAGIGEAEIKRRKWLWHALEECVTKEYPDRATKRSAQVQIYALIISQIIISQIIKISYLPIFNTYPVRKLLLSLTTSIRLREKSPPILRPPNPYFKHWSCKE